MDDVIFPEWLVQAAAVADLANLTSPRAAAESLLLLLDADQHKKQRKEVVTILVMSGLLQLVYRARSGRHRNIKRDVAAAPSAADDASPSGREPLDPHGSPLAQSLALMRILDLGFGGTTFGRLKFKQIDRCLRQEQAQASEHGCRARLLMWAKEQEGEGEQHIDDVITEADAAAAWRAITKADQGHEDEAGNPPTPAEPAAPKQRRRRAKKQGAA